jgi:hypothetical protein
VICGGAVALEFINGKGQARFAILSIYHEVLCSEVGKRVA